ncbi:MAG: discoidin domain-containing protein [Chloroflexi bacterium]|nr:MAG: discoidin domain-containing protein [Chloroflexota bacterium]
MNRVVSPVAVVVLLAIGLAILPALGLPYGRLDWIAFSQAYTPLENLALNRPAVASTYDYRYPPHLAVDGNLDTAWESSPHYRQWFYVLLDQPQWVNQVIIEWGAGYATHYRISVLVGGPYGYWQPVTDEVAGDGSEDFVSFPAVYGTAVAISMYGRAADAYNFSIREFEVFYFPDDAQVDNLAAGKPAYASTYQSGYEAGNATDADMATSWRPDVAIEPNVSSIYVDLGDTYTVAQVDLYWGDAYPARYRLYAWTFVWTGWTGYWAWWPLYNGSSAGGQDSATFRPTSTRYVRLVAYSQAGQGVDLKEFEVYSGPSVPGGGVPPGANYLTPDAPTEAGGDVLRDLVPPGWEKSPAWRQAPSKDGVPVPELIPLESIRSAGQ